MYEKFTDRARRIFQLANQEAQRCNHDSVDTQHVLLAIAKEGSGVAAQVLKNLNVDLRFIRLKSAELVADGESMVTMGKLPGADVIASAAANEAQSLNHNYVGSEHLLLTLLRDPASISAQILTSLGCDLPAVRQEILNLLREPRDDRLHYQPRSPAVNERVEISLWDRPMTQCLTTDVLSESEDQFSDQAEIENLEGQVASLTRANEILVCEKQSIENSLRIAQGIWSKIHFVLGSMSPKWVQEGGGIPIEDAACLAIASSFKDSKLLRAENSDWQSAVSALHVASPGWLKDDVKITDCARAAILGLAEKITKLKKKVKKLKNGCR